MENRSTYPFPTGRIDEVNALAELGLEEAQVVEAARLMSPAELGRLLLTLDRILEASRPERKPLLEAKRLPGSLAIAKKKYLDDLSGLLGELQQGEIDQKEFTRQARPMISDAFGRAYEIGVKRPLDDGDEEWLRRAVDAEVGHAAGLAKDVSQGNVKDVAFRAGNYAAALDGVAWNAIVENLPEGYLIHWKLGCLTSNSLTVSTARGNISLEQVRIGDMVLTHAGRFGRVLAKPVTMSTDAHRYAILVARGGRLVGLTDDHRLYTSRGWVTAREVANGEDKVRWFEEGSVQGLWEENKQTRNQMSGLLPGIVDEDAGGESHAGELQPAHTERSMLHSRLEREEVHTRAPGSMGLGAGEREASMGVDHPSCKSRPIRRQAGELDGGHPSRAQQDSSKWTIWERCSELEGRKDLRDLRALRDGIRGVRSPGGQAEVLLDSVQGRSGDGCQDECVGVRAMREGVRPNYGEDRTRAEERESEKFLLSRLLERNEEAGVASDPALRLLREDLRTMAVDDREVSVGDVVLLAGVLESQTPLYDLTVDRDQSFVVEGMVVHNSAEHCNDCILLASHSPYDRYSLPTTPRAGDTACRVNCKCSLVFEEGTGEQPQDGVFGIPGQLDDSLPRPTQGQSLADWLKPQDPPEGLSVPEGKDRLVVDALQGEVNYWRRAIAQLDEVGDPEEFLAAVEARKAANSKLIDYLEERDLWDAPLLSVDEVITGRDISLLAERELFEMSVGGKALGETAEREVLRLIEKYDINVGKKY